jgi:hypothetical protein
MNAEGSGWPRLAKVFLFVWVLAAITIGLLVLHGKASDVGDKAAGEAAKVAPFAKSKALERELHRLRRREDRKVARLPPASRGRGAISKSATASASSFLSPDAAAAFTALEGKLSARIGAAVAPLGSAPPLQFGSLESGHAWSSFKVPIIVAVMEREALSQEAQEQARSAITASDNTAAAALFSRLGSTPTASAAVETVLSDSGYPTVVATAQPPSGAVSTWGQTDWSLSNATGFYRALACGQLLGPQGTTFVLGLMEEVISEQQWGLGAAGIPAQVAFKAGWGPDGSASGPYLVRQSGILRSGSSGAVVTIAAQDLSGSFDAGVQDLDAVADWVRDNVRLNSATC